MGIFESKFNQGHRIIEVYEGFPAEEVKLQPFIDFIVAVNGTKLIDSTIPFNDIVKLNANCELTLEVYNLIEEKSREIKVTPRTIDGEGVLGVALRYENSIQAWSETLHITKVLDDGPAKEVGLVANEDFIVGSKDFDMESIDELEEYAETNPYVNLYVYSNATKSVRSVTINTGYPEKKGRLGLEIAIGALHSIK
ncbi:unnamed protein product [Blepharisma stoltei]|uniref:PDZ GRASP-type domain-containing protein n=1 Tax=Blepharisma stoltei TaxID=1481888 RepID=A0AAU9ISE4_9CILI|nr:unnamed protein product [Blepharisma stoltei]